MANSRFIQLTDYALLEYEYTDEIISTSDANFNRLVNSKNGDILLLNEDKNIDETGNVADLSATYFSPNVWAFMDIDTPTPIQNLEADYDYQNLVGTIGVANVRYDLVKVHILSGYNLNDLQGLFLQIETTDNTNKKISLASHVYLKSDSNIEFNPKPITISDRVYDRYLEVKIVNMPWVNSQFAAAPTSDATIGYQFTNENSGFKRNALIDVTLYEIAETNKNNGNLFFRTDNFFETTFPQADEFAQLSISLQESEEGDYYEFYPTWNGNFLEDFIGERIQVNQDWAVFHQIDVFEQVGTSDIRTMSFTAFQDGDFDKAMLFRPIILNADSAYSFSIEYIMRLFDRLSGEQIIREASISSTDVKKYGREIERINVNEGFRPFRILNKIEEGTKFDLPKVDKSFANEKGYKPVYYQMNNLGVQIGTIFPAGTNTNEFIETELIYGQGDAIIYISKFGTVLKFVVHRTENLTKEPQPIDLSGPIEYFLAFTTTGGNKIYLSDEESEQNMAQGELVFDIDGNEAEDILSKSDEVFYIISRDGFGKENTIYSGKVYNETRRPEFKSQIEQLKDSALNQTLNQFRPSSDLGTGDGLQ